MEENQIQNQHQQKDNTPKWKKAVWILIAAGSVAGVAIALINTLGDAPGQCIKNRSYTKNYKKRLDMDFEDMVRRDRYNRNRKDNG